MPPPADDSQPDEPTAAMPPGTVTLIGRARAGDASACDELFRRFLPRVRGLVSMRAGMNVADLPGSVVAPPQDFIDTVLAAASARPAAHLDKRRKKKRR